MNTKNQGEILSKVNVQEYFEKLPVCSFVTSLSGEITDVNETMIEKIESKELDLIGKSVYDLYSPEDVPTLKGVFADLEKYGLIEGRKATFVFKKGVEKDIFLTAESIKNEEGKVISYIFTQVSVTDEKEVEMEKEKCSFLLRNIKRVNEAIQEAESVNDMLEVVLDLTYSMLRVDRAWLLFPCDPDAPSWSVPMAKNSPDYPGLAPGDNIPRTPEATGIFKDALEVNEPIIFDPVTKRPAPMRKEMGTKSQMVFAIRPKIGKAWLFGVHQCTHPRIFTKEDAELFKEIGFQIANALNAFLLLDSLRESENKLRSLVDASPIVIMKISSDGDVVEFNEEAEKVYEKKREEVVGKNYFETFVPGESREKVIKDFKDVLEGKHTRGFENDVVTGSGKIRKMSWNTDRLLDNNGNAVGMVAIGLDVTEKKKSEEELASKVAELEELNESMIGREMKMIELKEKVHELEDRLDEINNE